MERRTGTSKGSSDRQTRLKSALKANLARRKAQARARATVDPGTQDTGTERSDGQTTSKE